MRDNIEPIAPALEYFGTITAVVDEPVELGAMHGGAQRVIPITGGTFVGPNAGGEILPGGADFQTLRSATVTELRAKYAIRLDSGHCITIDNFGLRTGTEEDIAALVAGDPVPAERIYFRCVPQLMGSGPWGWLSERIFIGTGTRHPDRVVVDVFLVA